MPKRIACIHQGYELYGSDRSFVESVAAIRAAYPDAAIEVVLPREGPITTLLAPLADRLTYEPLWVLRRQAVLRLATQGLARLPLAFGRALRRLRANDAVYVNTSVIVDYALAARFAPGKALLHIHEIPEGATRRILRALVLWSRSAIIFNSRATRQAFALPASAPSQVIYNGVAGPDRAEPCTYDETRPLRVLLLGRINRIKGQEVLVEAVSRLPPAVQARLDIRMVGSAFESAERERALRDLVQASGLSPRIAVEPFLPDPAPLYRWADIVVVPSRKPESLGRVAIEAMAFGRPPLASAIGGLVEVVADGETGWLVPPGDSGALAARLRAIVENPSAWRSFPAAGRARYEALFSERTAAGAIAGAVEGRLRAKRPPRPPQRAAGAIEDVP